MSGVRVGYLGHHFTGVIAYRLHALVASFLLCTPSSTPSHDADRQAARSAGPSAWPTR